MSVKHGLLALLAERAQHGYQLKTAFEARTAGTWPLNIGQVYTTLQRLERDGLVVSEPAAADGTVVYAVTDSGRKELDDWWLTPISALPPARDELVIKVALAVGTPDVDTTDLLRRQRTATLRLLQHLTRVKAQADDHSADSGATRLLILDRLIFAAEAESRWLDHVDSTLAARAAGSGTTVAPAERVPAS